MKRINKSEAPESFEIWKANFQISNGRAPTYNDLIGEEKQEIKKALLEEQGYICCYCMNRIDWYDSHIEHFRPRSEPKYSSMDLDYINMMASCNGAKGLRENCGHRKDNWFSERLTVSPLEKSVEELFTYYGNGEIAAANSNTRAGETISHFGLDAAVLTNHRRAAIRMALNEGALDDVDEWLGFLNERDADGYYQPFCQAIICVLESMQ